MPDPARRRSRAVTISDVARAAGVSPMTVSRVINGDAGVRPATRGRVEAAIAALDYAPNPAARSLAGGRRPRIGLVYANPSSGYLAEILVGGLDRAGRIDVQLVLETAREGERAADLARRIVIDGLDGVLLPPPWCDAHEFVSALAEAELPAVLVAAGHGAAATSSVLIDDRAAALAMTRHLLGLGHERIGFVTGARDQRASGERLQGYRDALAEAGLMLDSALVADGAFTYRSGLDAAEALLAPGDRPTAIFASNDDMAAAAIAVAHRHGLDVPADLTVCGFDDTALATTIWPELTTVRQPIAAMARVALDLLVDRLRRPGAPPERRVLDFALIRRQSDAAPRRRSLTASAPPSR